LHPLRKGQTRLHKPNNLVKRFLFIQLPPRTDDPYLSPYYTLPTLCLPQREYPHTAAPRALSTRTCHVQPPTMSAPEETLPMTPANATAAAPMAQTAPTAQAAQTAQTELNAPTTQTAETEQTEQIAPATPDKPEIFGPED
jgi:hypothetical protein